MQGKKIVGAALEIRNLQPVTSNVQPLFGRLRKATEGFPPGDGHFNVPASPGPREDFAPRTN